MIAGPGVSEPVFLIIFSWISVDGVLLGLVVLELARIGRRLEAVSTKMTLSKKGDSLGL